MGKSEKPVPQVEYRTEDMRGFWFADRAEVAMARTVGNEDQGDFSHWWAFASDGEDADLGAGLVVLLYSGWWHAILPLCPAAPSR